MKFTTPSIRHASLMAASALLFLGSAAQAQLIQNGGFEIAQAAGWLQSGNTLFSYFDDFAPHSGNVGASFGAPPADPAFLSQTITTQPGTLYEVSFWLRNDASASVDQPNHFSLNWGGGAVEFELVNADAFGYTQFSRTFAATASATELTFGFGNFASYWNLDDVSVSAVPEPAAFLTLSLGLLALQLMRRRQG